uniref:Putative lipocalin n=2 Tax=Ixodes ricinus TaxID=34613 RepID=A0A090X965_IXORI
MAQNSFIIMFCLFTCIMSDENQLQEKESDPTYEKFQHVEDVIEHQATLYMLYRTYTTDRNYECQYIQFGSKSATDTYPATLRYRIPGKYFMERKEVTVTLTKTAYTKPQDGRPKQRTAPNALVYTKVDEDEEDDESIKGSHTYPLIYADPDICAVMRDSTRDGGFGCEMYVSSSSTQPSDVCKTVYAGSCGNVKNNVWDTGCDQALEDADDIVWDE